MNNSADLLGLFPPSAALDSQGQLTVAGLRLIDLAERFGTPAYIVDESALRANVRYFAGALASEWPNSQLLFASKSFPCVAAYRLMAEESVGVDVAGPGELASALRAGVPGRDIVLHGNAKTGAEIEMAVKGEVGLIVVDNFDDLDKLERAVIDEQSVLVRVRPGVEVETHDAVATGHDRSKFGLPIPAARLAIERIRNSSKLRLAGLHTHIGSQILDLAPFREAVRAIATLGEFDIYDFGGGLGARYTYSDRPPPPEDWIGALTGTARECLPSTARLLIEPGRSLVARPGLTLYRIMAVKYGQRTIVAVDGGMADNMEVALFDQRFEATLVDRVGGGESMDLVGRHCESGDRISMGIGLDNPQVGDVLAVPVTGAYCYAMANNYNGALRPPVVFCQDGQARLVVRRESYDDYFSRDVSG